MSGKASEVIVKYWFRPLERRCIHNTDLHLKNKIIQSKENSLYAYFLYRNLNYNPSKCIEVMTQERAKSKRRQKKLEELCEL